MARFASHVVASHVAGLVAALLLLGSIASAETYTVGGLRVGDPWARATPKGAKVGAGYLTITNTGKDSDRLIGGSAELATGFEVHTTVVEKGFAKMRRVPALEIRPGETVALKPGGMHIMLLGLKAPLQRGQTMKGTVVFEKAGTLPIEFTVQAIGAPAGPDHHHH